jgi:acyl-CoA thioester hydrolase
MLNDPLDRPQSGRFMDGEHRFPVRVYFEDTDAGGVVYHASFLRFMERARSDMLRVSGIDQRGALEGGAGAYLVAELAMKYRRQGVVSRIGEIRAASCVIHQRVMRDGEVLAEADVTAAFLSPEGKPRRQPRAWIDIFKRLKGES